VTSGNSRTATPRAAGIELDLAVREDPVIVDVDGKASSAGYRVIRDVLDLPRGGLVMPRKDTVFAPEWTPERFARDWSTTPLLSLLVGEPPIV
jgi:hypothetical protein